MLYFRRKILKNFEGIFEYLGKRKKSIKLTISVKKDIPKIDKDGNETAETIFYKIKFVDSARSMAISLWNLVETLPEGIQKDCDCFLEYESVKENLIKYKYFSYNKGYTDRFDKKFKNQFKNTFTFSNNGINKFILLLRERVYPYE